MRMVGPGPGRPRLRRSLWKRPRTSERFPRADRHDDRVRTIDGIEIARVELFDSETLQKRGCRKHIAVAPNRHRVGAEHIAEEAFHRRRRERPEPGLAPLAP